MKELIEKTREYLDYVERHYNNVQKAWAEILDKCSPVDFWWRNQVQVLSEMDDRIRSHDKSKLSAEEFVQYRRYFYPTSYENMSKEVKEDMDGAWEHHLENNDHHWQNWTKTDPNNVLCLLENICDWMAMGYEFGDTAREYYENNKRDIKMPESAIRAMNRIFDAVYGKQ